MKQLDQSASDSSKTAEELETTSNQMQEMVDRIQSQIGMFKTHQRALSSHPVLPHFRVNLDCFPERGLIFDSHGGS